MSDLYETDILAWSEEQAARLRRHAAADRSNDAIDWSNVIEEIESVGNEQLHAVESLLLQALVHMLKAEAWPAAPAVPHWRAEARLFRAQATNRFAPSMLGWTAPTASCAKIGAVEASIRGAVRRGV